MTACRLTFKSSAALSNSASIGEAKSTFTLCIGPIMRPRFVKNRDTSLPASASFAMSSADAAADFLRMVFIELLFLFRRFPEGNEVVEFAFIVFAYFENEGVELSRYPADGSILLGNVGALVQIIWTPEHLARFFEAYSPLWILA